MDDDDDDDDDDNDDDYDYDYGDDDYTLWTKDWTRMLMMHMFSWCINKNNEYSFHFQSF
jgi:hypothetical protein